MSLELFLGGGGGIGPELDPFLAALRRGAGRRLLVVLAGRDPKVLRANALGYRDAFRARGVPVAESLSCEVSAAEPMTRARLEALEPCGVFVAGGLVGDYRAGLCASLDWVDHLREHGLPYAGFSAGAAIAAERALLGGWRRPSRADPARALDVLAEGYAEGIEELAVGAGLGLVPFAVEAHASQWGTVTRLLHAVEAGLFASGVALDENTVLRVREGTSPRAGEVLGSGVAYVVEPRGERIEVQLLEGRRA